MEGKMMIDCINSLAHHVMVMNNTAFVTYPFIDPRYRPLYRNITDKDDHVHLSELGYHMMLLKLTEFIVNNHEQEKLHCGQGSPGNGIKNSTLGSANVDPVDLKGVTKGQNVHKETHAEATKLSQKCGQEVVG